MNKYCYDICEHNKIERIYWSDKDKDGKNVTYSKAKEGTNQKLQCSLGFKQTVTSHKGLVNSQKCNSHICERLRIIYEKEK